MLSSLGEVDPEVAMVAGVGLATQFVRFQGISWGHHLVPLEERRGVNLNDKLRSTVLDVLR